MGVKAKVRRALAMEGAAMTENRAKAGWRSQAMSAGIIGLTAMAMAGGAKAADVFTVAKVAVRAEADNAVKAKEIALAEGEVEALRALLRRIVPVQSYRALGALDLTALDPLVAGFQVRSEQNSRTAYLATLDYSFYKDGVTKLLRERGLAHVEVQAPALTLVPLALDAEGKAVSGTVQPAWVKAWEGLDLAHTVTPVTLVKPTGDANQGLAAAALATLAGDDAATSQLATQAKAERVVVAAIQPGEPGMVVVRLAGVDHAGALRFNRPFSAADTSAETLRGIGAIALGIIEGRYKAGTAEGAVVDAATGPVEPVELDVAFAGLPQWRQIKVKLERLPGVANLEVSALSARGAVVRFDYPGGVTSLADRARAQNLAIEQTGQRYVLSAR